VGAAGTAEEEELEEVVGAGDRLMGMRQLSSPVLSLVLPRSRMAVGRVMGKNGEGVS
jgi:hypothetical protein